MLFPGQSLCTTTSGTGGAGAAQELVERIRIPLCVRFRNSITQKHLFLRHPPPPTLQSHAINIVQVQRKLLLHLHLHPPPRPRPLVLKMISICESRNSETRAKGRDGLGIIVVGGLCHVVGHQYFALKKMRRRRNGDKNLEIGFSKRLFFFSYLPSSSSFVLVFLQVPFRLSDGINADGGRLLGLQGNLVNCEPTAC